MVWESSATVVSSAGGDGGEDVADGGEAGFDADAVGVDGAGDDAADAGDEGLGVGDADDAGGGADDVDDVAEADVRADGIPVGVEGAGGDGDAGGEAQLLRPRGGEMAGDAVGGLVAAGDLSRMPARRGSTETRKSSGGGRPSVGSTSTCGPWRRCCGGALRGR